MCGLDVVKSLDLTLSIWKWEGCVVVGGTSGDFVAWAKRVFGIEIVTGEHSAGHAYVAYGQPWLLWVESLKNIPALAHEALHIASGVLDGRGLKHTPESEEAYTYTMEAIMRAVLTAKPKEWRRA